jgi:dTDP-4-amino-4,6-dideoxygalactose transaminase
VSAPDASRIPFNKPFMIGPELDYIRAAVERGHLAGDGPFTRQCREWLERSFTIPRALLTPSGTAALELAALLCPLEPGDEVILPSYTFSSTANAFVLRGAKPVFVDIREDTLNLDERPDRGAHRPAHTRRRPGALRRRRLRHGPDR